MKVDFEKKIKCCYRFLMSMHTHTHTHISTEKPRRERDEEGEVRGRGWEVIWPYFYCFEISVKFCSREKGFHFRTHKSASPFPPQPIFDHLPQLWTEHTTYTQIEKGMEVEENV
jgi:hypothetical protein